MNEAFVDEAGARTQSKRTPFRERQSGPRAITALGAALVFVTVVTTGLILDTLADAHRPQSVIALSLSAVIVIGTLGAAALVMAMNAITVHIRGGRVIGRHLPFRVFSIPTRDILRVEPTTITRTTGFGYVLARKARYLLLDDGPGVLLSVQGGRTYAIRSSKPDELVAAINAARSDSALDRSARADGAQAAIHK